MSQMKDKPIEDRIRELREEVESSQYQVEGKKQKGEPEKKSLAGRVIGYSLAAAASLGYLIYAHWDYAAAAGGGAAVGMLGMVGGYNMLSKSDPEDLEELCGTLMWGAFTGGAIAVLSYACNIPGEALGGSRMVNSVGMGMFTSIVIGFAAGKIRKKIELK